MKKLLTIFALLLSLSVVKASNYKLDNQAIDNMFDNSEELSITDANISDLAMDYAGVSSTADGKTQVGFLVRAWFCGGIALHRYYMGTNQKWMWAMYFCIPVVGYVNVLVDFWASVFIKDNYLKYANNDKYIVWLD
ncbi:MAG: hypothetical protein J0M08_11190 [Bacteroidetes bacterium]|nr:hypothetical protein [Bacteroidota bacterium]